MRRRTRTQSVPRRHIRRTVQTPRRSKTPFPRKTPRHCQKTPLQIDMPRPLSKTESNRGKLYLFVQYYQPSDPRRRAEIDFCLTINVCHAPFDKVFVLKESHVILPATVVENPKLCLVSFEKQPTFDEMIKLANHHAFPNCVNFISNSDICFDHSIESLRFLRAEEALNLSRWDVTCSVDQVTYATLRPKSRPYCKNDSFDVWVVRGPWRHKVLGLAQFRLGIPGCDNRFAWILQNAGYVLRNPSKNIYCYHVHNTNIRSYSQTTPRVAGPYAWVEPCHWPL
jgi:hypothetical protein